MKASPAKDLAAIKTETIETEAGCWEWQGRRNLFNYGEVSSNGQRWMVHRLTYTLVNGPIPDGLHICHKCDNPPCCNPDHLFAGTRRDNLNDSLRKGRQWYQTAPLEVPLQEVSENDEDAETKCISLYPEDWDRLDAVPGANRSDKLRFLLSLAKPH